MVTVQILASATLVLTNAQFFDQGGTDAFMARVAFTLGIPIERFRVVDVVQVNTRRRHRSLLSVSTVVDFSVLSKLEADETAMAAIRASEVNITGPQALLDDPPPTAAPAPLAISAQLLSAQTELVNLQTSLVSAVFVYQKCFRYGVPYICVWVCSTGTTILCIHCDGIPNVYMDLFSEFADHCGDGSTIRYGSYIRRCFCRHGGGA